MAITTVIAGPYTNTVGGNAMGYTKSGFNVKWRTFAERVGPEGTDIYGKSLLTLIGQGAACSLDAVFKVYTPGLANGIYGQWSGLFGQVYSVAKPIGQLAPTVAVVLTAVANTPAAIAGNLATLTVGQAVLTPDQDYSLILTSGSRDCPVSWDAVLSDSSGVGTLFTST